MTTQTEKEEKMSRETGRAVVFGGVPRLPDDALAYTRNEQDARLIAAAPSLYEALRALLPITEKLARNGVTEQTWNVLEQARAALKGTEGEK